MKTIYFENPFSHVLKQIPKIHVEEDNLINVKKKYLLLLHTTSKHASEIVHKK